MMGRLIKLILTGLIFLTGCATPEPEIRYLQSFNKPPEFNSYIQGDNYKLWYNREFHAQFMEIEKGSTEWKSWQESMGTTSLDRAFYNRESGVIWMIAKNRYKMPYDKIVNNLKKSSDATLIESDQRMVNNKPVLYVRIFRKYNDNDIMMGAYYINSDSGLLFIAIGCLEEDYGKFKKNIQDALNGIEVN